MENKIQELLDEVIITEIDNLSHLDSGSQEKSEAIENIAQLHKLRIEESKIDMEKIETILKNEQRRDQAFDRWVNVGLQVGLAIGGWIAYDIWNRRGLKFEETGSITSPMTRNLLSRMLPSKK